MVYNGNTLLKMDDLGVQYHYFPKHPCNNFPGSKLPSKFRYLWQMPGLQSSNLAQIQVGHLRLQLTHQRRAVVNARSLTSIEGERERDMYIYIYIHISYISYIIYYTKYRIQSYQLSLAISFLCSLFDCQNRLCFLSFCIMSLQKLRC